MTTGRPPPSLYWFKDGILVDESFVTINDLSLGFVVENELLIRKLDRDHLNSKISCEAINNNLTSRSSATITLDINCELLILFMPLTQFLTHDTSLDINHDA